MATKANLAEWLLEALKANDGRATIVTVCKHIWGHHEAELRRSGDLFYTWQYDVRWAAHYLRRTGVMRSAQFSPKGLWELQ